MHLDVDSQTPATAVRDLNEKRPAAVKIAIMTGLIAWTMMLGFAAMVMVFSKIGGDIQNSTIPIGFILLNITLLASAVGVIASIVVLAQLKRWKKTGVIGLISNGLPLLLMIFICVNLYLYLYG